MSKRTYFRYSPKHKWHILENVGGPQCVQAANGRFAEYMMKQRSDDRQYLGVGQFTTRTKRRPHGPICKRCARMQHFKVDR